MKTRFLTLLCVVSITIGSSGCDNPCIGRALAELGIRWLTEGAVTLVVGTPFTFQSIIRNGLLAANQISDCDNLDQAGPSRLGAQVDYWSPISNNWVEVGGTSGATPSLNPNHEVTNSIPITFNQPGYFRVLEEADYTDVISEHDVVSNLTTFGDVDSRSSSNHGYPFDYDKLHREGYVIVTVHEEYPGQAQELANLPIVQFE